MIILCLDGVLLDSCIENEWNVEYFFVEKE